MAIVDVIAHLPSLRRYARAVTGDQESGDDAVALMLEQLVARSGVAVTGQDSKLELYKALSACLVEWDTAAGDGTVPTNAVTRRLQGLSMNSRQAMLLTSLEGLSEADAALALNIDAAEIQRLLRESRCGLRDQLATDVLIIEDEFFISRDLAKIASEMGHRIIARARTHAEAVVAVAQRQPGLVLADVHLADGSSGIEAVNDILKEFQVPVIFITAYPDRLLTGIRPEPTFLIAKPYRIEEVKAVIDQALFLERRARPAK